MAVAFASLVLASGTLGLRVPGGRANDGPSTARGCVGVAWTSSPRSTQTLARAGSPQAVAVALEVRMVRTTMVALAITLLLAGHASPAGLSDADTRALNEVTKRYVETALASNWDAWASLLTEDAVFLPSGGPAVEGRAALRAWVVGFTGLATLTETPEEFAGRDGLAYGRGKYAYAMGPTARAQGADAGGWIKIYEKQRDGTWRIKRNIWNSGHSQPQK